ncbi:MAG: 2-C-methyl-D-erythritol 2,4-cyclodiphosphate synthase [Clostridiales bacterium]|nr:2-C-methyl-D-erythritol 2,4-cyclodiphosphate synthase [Clostridiales bacterium]
MILALIAAAGTGSRTGLKDNKIFFSLEDGQTVIEKTVNTFLNAKRVNKVCLICSENDKEKLKSMFGEKVLYCIGGKTRGESVINGLNQCNTGYGKVLIHDGARPFVTEEIINNVIDGIDKKTGAVAGVKVTDTIKITDSYLKIQSTPQRENLWAAQTPQGFMFDEILYAYNLSGTDMTDDANVFENAGFTVKMVQGGYFNKKITTKEDVIMPKVFLSGTGFDVHQLVKERPLILGGVEIPHEKGLLGHSDADVLLHAIMDALLGAAGLGDIGKHFPDTDEKYKGISSMLLFKEVVELLKQNGFEIINISAVVMAQKPKLKPYIEQMNINIADVSGIKKERVNVAATTTEKLGFVGREEGISAQATVMIRK